MTFIAGSTTTRVWDASLCDSDISLAGKLWAAHRGSWMPLRDGRPLRRTANLKIARASSHSGILNHRPLVPTFLISFT